MGDDNQWDQNAAKKRRGPLWWLGLGAALAVIVAMTVLRQFNT